ncbi:MAG: ribonuclease III [Tannerellaceae bacterium]|jgi:ribonuclease-3|nr:ribonuclease III [Tannerellaceae bacterium]
MIRLHRNKKREPYPSLYKLLGFYPDNVSLYEEAFLHTSAAEFDKGRWHNNERLEFLGDAVLNAVVTDILYKYFPNRREGFLTNTRSKIVQRENMNRLAVQLGLNKMLVVTTRLSAHNNYVYGNALEALIGAVYLDRGYRKCYRFIEDVIIKKYTDLDSISRQKMNYKSALIEWSQKNKLSVTFEVMESFIDGEGNPVFQSEVILLNRQVGVGIGYSKKESHQNAAKMAIGKLRTDKEIQKAIYEYRKNKLNSAADAGIGKLPDDDPAEEDVNPNNRATRWK